MEQGPSPRTDPSDSSSEGGECTFLVRVRKGKDEARVIFVSDEEAKGWESPFNLALTMEDMANFHKEASPRAYTSKRAPRSKLRRLMRSREKREVLGLINLMKGNDLHFLRRGPAQALKFGREVDVVKVWGMSRVVCERTGQ